MKKYYFLYTYNHTLGVAISLKTLYKFKACDTKSIASAIISLKNCEFIINNDLNHAKIILHNSNDELLVEAFNQITTVESTLNNQVFSTNYSRYLWKLNPEFKENKTRLILLRILKPIGLFFLVRNTNSNIFLTLNDIEFKTFQIKWNSIYPNLPFASRNQLNYHEILFNESFHTIINEAANKHIIDVDPFRKTNKQIIIYKTIEKLNNLIN